MKTITNANYRFPGATYPLTRKPLGIWKSIKANFYYRFRPSKLAFVGISAGEVVRMPDGTLFVCAVARQVTNPARVPMPPKHLSVFQMPNVNAIHDLQDPNYENVVGGDNMPEECSPEADEVEDLTAKLTREAADLEDAASPTIPSIKKE